MSVGLRLSFLLVLLPVVLAAPFPASLAPISAPPAQAPPASVPAPPASALPASAQTKTPNLRQIRIDDQTVLLYDETRTFVYLGSIDHLKNGKLFPHGTGIRRTITKDPNTGDAAYEYCLGTWKRGALHGKAIQKRPDGTYRNTTWRWDRLKSVSAEAPSPEEIATLEKAIARLEKLMTML